MFNHEPAGYRCPFCDLLAGNETPLNTAGDIVVRRCDAVAFISPRWWPRNPGHVLVAPTAHYENLYDLPDTVGHAVHDLARDIAVALRHAYGCDGTSTRQHNEPAGGQDVWHYHLHVFPRYHGDDLYRSQPEPGYASTDRRAPFADKLRSHLHPGSTSPHRPR